MRDSNIPKFLTSDLPLFSALISDLFPGIVIPKTTNPELEQMIDESMAEMLLQRVDIIK